MSDAVPICLNCETPLSGAYCHECGQRHIEERLSIRRFLREIPQRFLSLDRGLLHTFKGLATDPGQVAHDYVHGRRQRYTSPMTFWVIAATLQLLALYNVNEAYVSFAESQFESSLAQQPDAKQMYGELFGVEDPTRPLAQMMVNSVRAAYTYLGVFLALAFAMGLRFLTAFDKRPLRIAEQLVFALYMIGFGASLTALIMPITFRISPALHSVIGMMVYFAIVSYASFSFHRAGWRGSMMTVLSFVLALGLYMMVIVALLAGMIVWTAVTA